MEELRRLGKVVRYHDYEKRKIVVLKILDSQYSYTSYIYSNSLFLYSLSHISYIIVSEEKFSLYIP
jgi:hypothetical protein